MYYKLDFKPLYIFFFTLISTSVISQSIPQTHHGIYVPKNYFNSRYVKKDSIGFMVKNGDTLIAVAKYIKPKGVGVSYEPKDSTFLEIYKPLAFQPNKKNNTISMPMKYWKEPLKVFFTPNISKKVKREFSKFSKLIDKEVDSLKIINVKTLEEANYIIYTEDDFEYESNLKTINTSGYYIYWNKRNQINKGYLKINTAKLFSDLLQIQKIKIEFIYSLGWFKPTEKLDCTSYFSNCFSDKKRLGKLDLEILKYHYSYGICKGTRLQDFEELHTNAKKALKNPRSRYIIYHHD